MSLLPFFQWLESTDSSQALVESEILWAIIESIHVWTLPIFFGLTAVLDLRLLGQILRKVPVTEVSRKLLPWMTAGFVVLVATGLLLLFAKPVRTYQSIWFRGKLVMLCVAGINVWMFNTGIYRRVSEWDLGSPPRRARMAGALSLVVWAMVIVFGRMIAYNWADCTRQPQPAVINLLAGCVVAQR
jgi:hypothetical protein